MSREPIFSITKKDFKIDWFSGTGPGGQNRNKKQACCRITHIESGITAQSTEHRERPANLRDAFRALAERLRPWIEKKVNGDKTATEAPTEIVRTYHEVDNRVVDKSGHRQTWDEVRSDLSEMIEERRNAMLTKARENLNKEE